MEDTPNRLISYLTVRKVIGWLAILLPVALIFNSLVINKMPNIENSISDYYYTNFRNEFIAIIAGIAMFLFTYTGFDPSTKGHKYAISDSTITNACAIFALCIALFPCRGIIDECCQINHEITNWGKIMIKIHFISASLFFITLAVYSIFYFTITNREDYFKDKNDNLKLKPQKARRNRIYRICGYMIFAAIVYIFIQLNLLDDKNIFIAEAICLIAFGISWLVKGEGLWFLNDK